jgi:transketolase
LRRFVHLYARAHHFDRYGSQPFLRRQSGLDPASALQALSGH